MDLRGIANTGSSVVNDNTLVSVQASTGYTIGTGLKQVPSYADPVSGYAQVQALTAADLRHLDGLNIQNATKAIILKGELNAVVRPHSQGGDLVNIGSDTYLTCAVLEQWPLWSRCAIVLQEPAS